MATLPPVVLAGFYSRTFAVRNGNRVTSADGARIDLDVQELSRLSLKASQ
jgi:hypothetical protein